MVMLQEITTDTSKEELVLILWSQIPSISAVISEDTPIIYTIILQFNHLRHMSHYHHFPAVTRRRTNKDDAASTFQYVNKFNSCSLLRSHITSVRKSLVIIKCPVRLDVFENGHDPSKFNACMALSFVDFFLTKF